MACKDFFAWLCLITLFASLYSVKATPQTTFAESESSSNQPIKTLEQILLKKRTDAKLQVRYVLSSTKQEQEQEEQTVEVQDDALELDPETLEKIFKEELTLSVTPAGEAFFKPERPTQAAKLAELCEQDIVAVIASPEMDLESLYGASELLVTWIRRGFWAAFDTTLRFYCFEAENGGNIHFYYLKVIISNIHNAHKADETLLNQFFKSLFTHLKELCLSEKECQSLLAHLDSLNPQYVHNVYDLIKHHPEMKLRSEFNAHLMRKPFLPSSLNCWDPNRYRNLLLSLEARNATSIFNLVLEAVLASKKDPALLELFFILLEECKELKCELVSKASISLRKTPSESIEANVPLLLVLLLKTDLYFVYSVLSRIHIDILDQIGQFGRVLCDRWLNRTESNLIVPWLAEATGLWVIGLEALSLCISIGAVMVSLCISIGAVLVSLCSAENWRESTASNLVWKGSSVCNPLQIALLIIAVTTITITLQMCPQWPL